MPYIKGATNLLGTFENCTSLTDLGDYEIPNYVESMQWTFAGCYNLTKAPIIPASVQNCELLFAGCTNLSGTLIIDATPTSYTGMLKGTNITSIKMSNGQTHPMEAELLATING